MIITIMIYTLKFFSESKLMFERQRNVRNFRTLECCFRVYADEKWIASQFLFESPIISPFSCVMRFIFRFIRYYRNISYFFLSSLLHSLVILFYRNRRYFPVNSSRWFLRHVESTLVDLRYVLSYWTAYYGTVKVVRDNLFSRLSGSFFSLIDWSHLES